MGLDDVIKGQATDHGIQNLPHVAEGQAGLDPTASLHQLQRTGDQRNLAGAEHRLVYLRTRTRVEKHSIKYQFGVNKELWSVHHFE